MIISGKEAKEKATADEVAAATIEVFRKSVPADVAGVVFLSGGQSGNVATKNLCEINRSNKDAHPWAFSFSFGRALQDEALNAWHGDGNAWQAAQEIFYAAAKADAEARRGIC
jgi:fructose-bisphosphate aldolase class I